LLPGSSTGDNGVNDNPGTSVSTTISKTTDLYFKVNSRYLSEHRVVPSDIVIMSYEEQEWEALPTTFAHSSGNDFYFTANVDSYSVLAIGNRKEGNANLPSFNPVMGSPSVTSENSAKSPSSLAASDPQHIEYSAIHVPAEHKITAIPVDETKPASSSGISVPILAIIGTGCLSMGLCGLLIRRWWIRRQNPALFRKYD
jgi:hypothetical protein